MLGVFQKYDFFLANKASFQMQLKLALAWNRIDVAKSEIFTEDMKQINFKVSNELIIRY